ncbi:MAG: hypothetical protein WA172_19595 [Terriglobales bacterium]|jgi:hypothetical protein
MKNIKRRFLCWSVAVLSLVSISNAQAGKDSTSAPVPVQIGTARKVFISNGGGQSFETVLDQEVFNGGPDRPYNQFYAAMKAWGRYDLASSPSDAELVLEISWSLADTGLRLPVLGELRLVVLDPKTHIKLWTLSEHVRGAVLLGNRDKNFDETMNNVVSRMKNLSNLVPSPAGAASK